MIRKVLPTFIVATLLAGSPNAFAQRAPGRNDNARFGDPTGTGRAYEDYLFGVIKKIDKTALVLDKTRVGVEQTIKLEPKTKFVRDGKSSSLEELKLGEDVFVQTKKDKKTGELVAKKVLTGALPAR